jgi:hypothetical protein
MKVHGEAIFAGEPQPHLPLEFGYATGRPGRLYLYVATPPADGVLRVPGWRAPTASAALLAQPAAIPLTCACTGDTLEIMLPKDGLDPNLPIVAVDYAGAQPYLPRDAIVVRGGKSQTLSSALSLARHRMQGHDYYSQKKFVVAREWLLWPEIMGTGTLIVRRPAGGPAAGFRLAAAGQEAQFIFAAGGEAQTQACLELPLIPGVMVTVELRHITPRHELQDEGLVLEFRLADTGSDKA